MSGSRPRTNSMDFSPGTDCSSMSDNNDFGDDFEYASDSSAPIGRQRGSSVSGDFDPRSINFVPIHTSAPIDNERKQTLSMNNRTGPLTEHEKEALNEGLKQHDTCNSQKSEDIDEMNDAKEEAKRRMDPNSPEKSEKKIKILMLGNSGVGKSCLMNRWKCDDFSENLVGTIGVDYKARTIVLGNETCQVQVWDTAGQERYRTIARGFYKGSHAVLLVYDVTDKTSFADVTNWMTSIHKLASDNVLVLLVANKIDMRKSSDVTTTQGLEQAGKHRIQYFETSAKSGEGVSVVYNYAANTCMERSRTSSCSSISSPVSISSAQPTSDRDVQPTSGGESKWNRNRCRIS